MNAVEPGSALIEALDGHGRVQWRERLALDGTRRRFTIGRALDADITLDDPYAAALHAAIEISPEGRVLVCDLDSANGVVVAGKRHHGTSGVEAADGMLQVGRTKLRVRTSHERLAPEKPDPLHTTSVLRDPAWAAGIGAAAGAAQLVYSNWFDAPHDLASNVVTSLISASIAAGMWVAFWALLSRVIVGQGRWLVHAAIFLGVAVVSFFVDGLLDLAWFAFSLPKWPALTVWAGGAALACALYLHLTNATNLSARRAALIACLFPALSLGVAYWAQDRMQTRNVNYIVSDLRIYPPALRLRDASAVDSLFERASQLRAAADAKRDATAEDADEGEAIDEPE